ncbi:MAG: hypothetical protein K1Y36_03050 [Blastocatellia bacterium]|nr:hypothetical protein [Blastocatellia bacterium]
MERRTFLQFLTALAVNEGIGVGPAVMAQPFAGREADHPAVHGMVVLGTHKIYLSHLPLFSSPDHASPHNYQVLLEVELSQKGENILKNYVKDRSKTRATLYTFEPEKFVLPSVQFGGQSGPPVRTFRGKLYRGHFERQGTPIADEVTVNVTKVIHFHPFASNATRPESLQYILFGNEKECFAAHYITRPPDFDHLVPVMLQGEDLTSQQLASGLLATFPKLKDTASDRLRYRQTLPATCAPLTAPTNVFPVSCQVGADIYLEENELAS